jgi:hypothetical protein
VALGDAFEQFLQIVVDSLPVAILANDDPVYGILA